MANYCCAVRTNYFHVKDKDRFKKFMENVISCEDNVDVWEEKDAAGNTVFGFGCYGSILGIDLGYNADNDYCEYDYNEFIDGLSDIVADDDAIIILESGNEKLRYVVGGATIITSNGYDYLDIATLAAQAAAEMIGNPSWKTRIDY